MKNLENYGIYELNTKEMVETSGGIYALLGGVLLAAYYIGYAVGYTENH